MDHPRARAKNGPVLVGNVSTAARLSVWAPALTLPVIVSEGMADDALGAIDAAAIASAEGDAVEIVSSTEAVLHSETDPLAIATVRKAALSSRRRALRCFRPTWSVCGWSCMRRGAGVRPARRRWSLA